MTCLIKEYEDGDAWAQEADTSTSTKLEPTNAYSDIAFSLQTDACHTTLSFLNLSWLSAMIPIIRPYKHYANETNEIKANNTNIQNMEMHFQTLEIKILKKFGDAFP